MNFKICTIINISGHLVYFNNTRNTQKQRSKQKSWKNYVYLYFFKLSWCGGNNYNQKTTYKQRMIFYMAKVAK